MEANNTGTPTEPSLTPVGVRQGPPEALDRDEPRARTVALGLLVLGLIHLAPLSVLPTSRAATRSTDVQELMWRLLWGVHALVTGPARLMNANTFFPNEGTYATMDYLVGVSVLAAPFRALTRDPLTVYNLTALASAALSAWGAYLLARALTKSSGAAAVAAAVFAFNPVHTARIGQLNVFAVHALPFLLLALHRLFLRTSMRAMLLVAAGLLVALTSSGYQAVFASAALAWAVVVLGAGDPRTRWRALAATTGAVSLAAVLFAPLAWPYVRGATEQNRTRTIREVQRSSPSLVALVLQQSTLHDRLRTIWDQDERVVRRARATLFPGVVVVGLATIGLVSWTHRPEYRRLALLYGGLAIGGFAFSLGTNLPGYAQLFEWLPPLQLVRAPSRFSLLGLLGLSVLAAGGVVWLKDVLQGRRAALLWALVPVICALHLVETWRPVGRPTLRYSPPPAVYEWLAAQPGEFGIVELPTDPEQNTTALVYSTFHWKPLVNGYHGSFISRFHDRLLFDVLPSFPKPAAVQSLSEITGLRYVVVHVDPAPEHFPLKGRYQHRRRLRQALESLPPTLRLVWRSDEDAVLELVEPPLGWSGLQVNRVVSGASLRGRTLSFEARAIESPVGPLEAAEVVVVLDDHEVGRAAISNEFHRYTFELPEAGIAPGMHLLRFHVRGAVPRAQLAKLTHLAIGRTGVSTAAWIRAVSEDPERHAPARIEVNGAVEVAGTPGYSLAVVDPASARIHARASFDVAGSRKEADRLAGFLEALPAGAIVAAATTGPIDGHCTSRMALALGAVGTKLDPCSGGYRTHAFVGVRGAAPGTAAESHSRTTRAAVEVGSELAPTHVAVRRFAIGTGGKLDR